MSLAMRIFYGRTDPEKSLEDDGKEGPTLINIESADYSNGNLFLKFNDSRALNIAQSLTKWNKVDPALITRFAFPCNTREFVTIHDSESNDLFYYSDFIICTNDPFQTMQLTLSMNEITSKKHLPQKRELVIDNVETLRFTFGTYRIWLDSHKTYLATKQITGWNEGIDHLDSLEMLIAPATEAIMTWDAAYQGDIPLLFDRFDLKSVPCDIPY